MTTGIMIIQEVSHEPTQFISAPSAPIRQIVIAAAIAVVSPDWINANKKCAYRCGSMGASSSRSRTLSFSIDVKPTIHQSDDLVEQGMLHAALPRDELHELVGPLDVECTVVERASGRGRP